MDVAAYLRHLGVENRRAPTLDFLRELQRRHIESVLYENIDVIYARPISLDPARILEKFIVEARGGICFETNGAFHALLLQLGFDAELFKARIYGFLKKEYETRRDDHIVVLVRIAGRRYLADVGWSGQRVLLDVEGEEAEDSRGSYRLRTCPSTGRICVDFWLKKRWFPQYQVLPDPIGLADCHEHLDFRAAHKERTVARKLLVNRYFPEAERAIVGNSFNRWEEKGREKWEVEAFGGLEKVLVGQFGIAPEFVSTLAEVPPGRSDRDCRPAGEAER